MDVRGEMSDEVATLRNRRSRPSNYHEALAMVSDRTHVEGWLSEGNYKHKVEESK